MDEKKMQIRNAKTCVPPSPIFVYESHPGGTLNYGDAKIAKEQYGAVDGFCVGRHGNSYAIPTDFNTIEGEFTWIVEDFIAYAKQHDERTFIVNRIRCERSLINEEDVIPLFKDAFFLPNVQLPDEWLDELLNLVTDADYKVCPIRTEADLKPRVMNETSLYYLCIKYKTEIGCGLKNMLPKVRIRYVLDNKKFGYADFGDYFIWIDDILFVWHEEEEFAESCSPDVVEDFFGHECKGRGYDSSHIFAGIDTGYDDDDGCRMFTGDIVQVMYPNGSEMGALCLASLVGEDGEGFYGFPLDNHSLTLQMCKEEGYHLRRIGTIFYQLIHNEDQEPIWEKALTFNNNRWTEEEYNNHLVMARYTPNFYQEVWKYLGYEILGIDEFEWR